MTLKNTIQQTNVDLSTTLPSIIANLKSEDECKVGQYVWKKLDAQGGNFLDFVTADTETKYPDGGEQGGYWYERVVEGLNPLDIGFSKKAIDTVTYASNTPIKNAVINHSLEVSPKFILIISDRTATLNENDMVMLTALLTPNDPKFTATHYDAKMYSDTSDGLFDQSTGISNVGVSSFTITYDYTSSVFSAGVEYTIITMG